MSYLQRKYFGTPGFFENKSPWKKKHLIQGHQQYNIESDFYGTVNSINHIHKENCQKLYTLWKCKAMKRQKTLQF